MKYYSLVACLLVVVAAPSCTPTERKGTSDPKESAPVKITPTAIPSRKAVIEHRFPKATDCKIAAKEYFNKEGHPGEPATWDDNPLIYSFVKTNDKELAQEIRFRVDPSINTNIVISYYEVEIINPNPTDITNGKEIREKIKVLRERGARIVKKEAFDKKSTNGKKSWRAIIKGTPSMLTSPKATPADSSQFMLEEEFGIIINPPYP